MKKFEKKLKKDLTNDSENVTLCIEDKEMTWNRGRSKA
jgi:hypothetical protein